ncbi:MAG: N-acetylneuraminate synthase family protein [Fibrobacteres bacterium]|nr:N-acetylneuraminate synthase family protein [Fibrobacterota bacterium]
MPIKSDSVYIIGEIGQNHNGSVDIAKLIVDLISRPISEDLFDLALAPMDAVKMTKRDLSEELSQSQMNREYSGAHSFGRTYGEHRKYLELTDEQHYEVYLHAKSKGLEFVETLCGLGCLSILKYFLPDYLKVASRDLTNLPLLDALAKTKIPIILSTGMAGQEELDSGLETIVKHHEKISILHCVSEYPTRPSNVNLLTVTFLKKKYPNYFVGFSDHTIGISAPVAAVALGATIIEKHVTIDRRMKGTDQAGSLGPDGVIRMVRDIRLIHSSMGEEKIFVSDGAKAARVKLERSIAANREIHAGEIIGIDDLHLLSPGDGFKWVDKKSVLGKTAATTIPKDEIIYPSMLK